MMNFLAYSTDIPGGVGGKFGYGLGVTAIGMVIVFAVLILIMLVIYLFQLIFYTIPKKRAAGEKKESAEVKPSVPAPVPVPASSVAGNQEELVAAIAAATAMAQEELIAVLSAAVAAQEGCDAASTRYRIRSFRRIL